MASPPSSDTVATALLLRTPTKIDTVVLDASVDEQHTAENDVTDHAVETGFAVSDHVRAKPDMLTIQGIVTNTPMSATARTRTIQALGITFQSATDADAIVGQPGYAEQAYAMLRAVRDTGKLITVVTSLRTYDSMVMMSLVVPRNKDTGDSLRFTAVLKQIRVVSNKLTAAKRTSSAGKKVSTGKQAPKTTAAGTQNKSIMYDIKEQAPQVVAKIKSIFGGTP